MQPTAQAVGGGREEGASPGGGERKICRVFFRPFRGSYILGASIPRLTAWAAFFRAPRLRSWRAPASNISSVRRVR